jgi:hypothetical protein
MLLIFLEELEELLLLNCILKVLLEEQVHRAIMVWDYKEELERLKALVVLVLEVEAVEMTLVLQVV